MACEQGAQDKIAEASQAIGRRLRTCFGPDGSWRSEAPGLPAGRLGQRRCSRPYLKDRSRRLLLTTKTDENAIAAPAIIGLSMPSAASGRAATL